MSLKSKSIYIDSQACVVEIFDFQYRRKHGNDAVVLYIIEVVLTMGFTVCSNIKALVAKLVCIFS